ncbi:recombinase family protein [Vibrio sinaloensis]|uniref:recombinase family protein n=1 Tax=Photobacterium sp. (strain ATCC 43367) TaxID=379097 RepID=UPI0022AF3BCD|nr:recombinase family protein [Vibrio sinaloensis]MCZ4295121.1 recombinase family protein [Vibrio sinaloensis]
MKAYSYKRFSSKQQRKGDSLRRQNKLINDYCYQHNLALSEHNFEDLGVSAFRSTNSNEDSGLGQFLLALQENKISTPCYLLVESLDRLSRDNVKTAMRQLWSITDYNVTVVTLSDSKQYTRDMDFTDFLMAGLIMQRANEESQTKSCRLLATWENRRTNPNAPKTKNCPFWLTLVANKQGYSVNDSVQLLHRIYDLALNGLGSPTIAKTLNREGIPSPTGKTWTDATITKTLNSRSVLGEYQPHQRIYQDGKRKDVPIGEPLKGFYPAIFSEAYFNQVQAAIKSRAKSKNRGATKSHLNVVKGIATCSLCGGNIRLKKQSELYYLQCAEREKGLCNSKPINLRFLSDWLSEVWTRADYAPISASETPESEKLKQLESKLSKAENVISGLLRLLDGTNDSQILSSLESRMVEKRELMESIEKLEAELAPYNLDTKAMRKRYTLVKLAFMQSSEQDIIIARNQLALLLNQLKGFKVVMVEGTAYFDVVTPNGELKRYQSVNRPYYKGRMPQKIWSSI